VIIVANNLEKNRKVFMAEVQLYICACCVIFHMYVCILLKTIISLSDKRYLDNVPHLVKLSDQPLLDSKLPNRAGSRSSSFSISTSDEESPSFKRNISPMFVKDGSIQHSLQHSFRASSHESLLGSTFTDSDSSFNSASSDESMSYNEPFSALDGSIDQHDSGTGRIGSIVVRSKKHRKCSKEQRKSLMQHIHMARCKKEKIGMN